MTTPNAVTTTYTYDRLNRQTQVSSTSTDENGQPTVITSSVTYTWDGKVQTSTDANGNISSNVYNTRGLLTKTIDACGNTTAKYYDNAGRQIAVVSALNYDPLKTLDQMSRTEYAYDLMGNVKTVTQIYYDNQTNEWVTFVEKAYQYDSLGNVTKELGAIGYASGTGTSVDDRINTGDGILYFYNLGGKLTLKLTSNTEPTQYTYDALGRVTSKSNERGVKTGYTYDGAGKLLTEKVYIGALSEEQTVHSYTYDLLGQVLSQTDGNGNTTTYTYNALGKVRQTTSPGDSTVPSLTSYCQYNTSGNVSVMWTSAGKKETDTYDNQGHILSKTQSATDGSSPITVSYRYDKNGNVRYSTDGNGNVTSATYDAMNRALTQTKGSIADGYQTTTVTYDANGNKVTTTDWRGNTSTNMYDAMNRLIEQKDAYGHTVEKYTYNNNSLQVTATDALGNVTAFAYDREDRLIQTTDPAGHITSQIYNNLGLVDSKTDGNGNTTSYIYDQRNRLQTVVNAANEATFYTYDANGNVLTLTDGLGHVTTYEYNCRNQLIKTINDGGRTGTSGNYTYDLSKVQSYTYTADGQAATKTDRNGNTTTYTYDIHGNLLSQTVEAAAGLTTGATTVSYTYDNNGNTLTMTDTTGTTTRVYDSFNRTTSKTVPDMGTSTYAYDITAGMDAGCTAQTTTDPKGNVTQKVYDRVGRISEVIADGMTTVYHYNDNGSVQSVVYSDGSREDYTYTSDNHLDTLTNTKSDSTVIDSYSYTYDAAHNMLSKVDARGTTAYIYDSLNRLLTVTEPSGKTTGYTYDASGNRLTETDTLGTDITVITYTYDFQNRLTGTVTTLAESTGAAAVTSTVAYTYDNNGNQLSKTTTAYIDGVSQTEVVDQANDYDLFNQLIATVTSAGVIVINTYNGDGLRVGKSVNGELTRYLYEYQKVVLEENAAGDQTGRNVYGINLLTRQAKDDTDTPAYTLTYMYNGHADVTALLDTAGNVVATYYYDAFGNILAQTGTVNNSILYTGYQYDKETGLYYLNARMYDPVTARFMQEDTYTGEYNDPLSLNLYTYCNNDPLMYSDPTGHSTLDDYEYQKNVEKRRNTLSSTLDNYSYQNTTKKTSSRQSNSLDNYYYNQDMSDAHLLQQTREQQKAPQTITSTAKSTTNDSAMISFLLNPDTSAYLTSGQYQQTLAWVDQERIDRGGSILISGLQLSTDPTSKGYNERDLALYQAINKITCFNGDIGNTDKLLGALENRYTALGIDSSNALTLDAQGMKNLSAVAADRDTAINGGTGFNLLKFQEENLYTSGIISTTVTAATYGGLMTTYAGSGQQKTSLTKSDIIDAQVATGNVEYAKTMNALTDEQWAAMSGSGEASVAEGGSKLDEVFKVADNYKLSDDVFDNHILDRHGPQSLFKNKSHFNSNFDIKEGIDSTLKGDNFLVKPNTNSRDGYIFEQTFKNPIGVDSKGKPLNTLKVVIDESGNVVTAFPKK